MNLRRGLTYMEVLIALLLVSMAAAAAIATWRISLKAVEDKRVTEMGVYIASSEIERQKAIKYTYLTLSTKTYYYDRWGNWLGVGAASGAYKAVDTISVVAPNPATGSDRDLLELRVVVSTGSGAVQLEDTRTMMTFGGY